MTAKTKRRIRCSLATGVLLAPVLVGATGRADAAPLAAGGTLRVHVRELAGLPPSATAVVMNVTVADPAASGFVTAFPCGAQPPTASNLNHVAGETIPNLVAAKLDAQGDVCLFTKSATNLVADVTGYFPDTAAFVPLPEPRRALDTRDTPNGRLAASGRQTLSLAGVGVPLNARAVVVNTTAVDPSAPGYLTVWPCDQDLPTASNLNYAAGQTIPNLVVVRPSPTGEICLYTQSATDVVVDVAGYLPSTSTLTALAAPARVVDTRLAPRAAPIGAEETLRVDTSTRGVPPGSAAAVLNVTAAEALAPGFLTVWPCDEPRPLASNLNYVAGQNIPNLVFTRLNGAGEACVYAKGATHVVVDLTGWFPSSASYVSLPVPLRILDTRRAAASIALVSAQVPYKPTFALAELFTISPAGAPVEVADISPATGATFACSYAAGVLTLSPAPGQIAVPNSCTMTVRVLATATNEPAALTRQITFNPFTPALSAVWRASATPGNSVLHVTFDPPYGIDQVEVRPSGGTPCVAPDDVFATAIDGVFDIEVPTAQLTAGCEVTVSGVQNDAVSFPVSRIVAYVLSASAAS